MYQENDNLKYFLYARKSSEDKSKQIQSIDDQVKIMEDVAARLNLNVIETLTETKSAKKPDNRPVFTDMLRRIQKGEAQGILCWKLDRLSRNPKDSGTVQQLVQDRIVKCIQTPDKSFRPEDNAILFSVETGMANQFILDLRKNVKRGMDSKVEKGWAPNVAPMGYINVTDPVTDLHYISKDPERFKLVRKMWDYMLTGHYTPPKILEIVNNKWGFKTRKTKRLGGKELSLSGLYRIFGNMFYTGVIDRQGKQYPGKHEAMITMEEYDRVQAILGSKGHARPQKHEFAFTGTIRCGECGCMHTAETKKKLIKRTGDVKYYTYYHCTRRRRRVNCTQKKALLAEELEIQIEKEIERYTILPEFLQWAIEGLNGKNDSEIEDRTKIYEMQHKALTENQAQLDRLTQMRYRDQITDEEFNKERAKLQSEIAEVKIQLRDTEDRAERWLELTEKTFTFATYARKAFLNGGLELKKEILLGLGESPIIKDKTIIVEPNEWLVPIKNAYPALEQKFRGLEPIENGSNKEKSTSLKEIHFSWLGSWDSNPGPIG